ncbi:hypothetical protein MHYP_G00187770 [Metynnis hypsauchen]
MFISESMTVDNHIYSSLDCRHGFQCIIPPGLEALDSSDSYMSSRNSGQEDCLVSGPDQRTYIKGSLDKTCSKTFRDSTINHHWTLYSAFIFIRSSITMDTVIIILATDPGPLETSGPMKRRSVPSSPLDIVIIRILFSPAEAASLLPSYTSQLSSSSSS